METATGSGPRTFVVWGVGLLAASWLALTAAGGVLAEKAPGAAVGLFPKNGFAYQNRALAAASQSETLRDIRITPAQLADAREALRREPLSSTALTLIGIDRDARGKRDEAVRIVGGANAMDKRQVMANAWLIGHYGNLPGQSRRVLSLLDEALKIRPELAGQYMPAFAQALTNADTVPVFQKLLNDKPSWEPDFWQAVASNDAALTNAGLLRGRILAGSDQPDDVDTLLMSAFIGAKRMDLAFAYARNLPELPEDRDNLIRNSSFGALPGMAPLDWELTNDGRISTAVDEGRGTLEVNVIAGSAGTVARQLVGLQPGAYVLLVKLARGGFARGSDLTVALRCAEANAESVPPLSVRVTGDTEHAFALPDESRCRYYWVDLVFSALDSSGPASTNIAEVRIVRARARQSTEAVATITDGRAPE